MRRSPLILSSYTSDWKAQEDHRFNIRGEVLTGALMYSTVFIDVSALHIFPLEK